MATPSFKQFGYVDTYTDLAGVSADEGQLVMTKDTKVSFIMTGGAWLPFARTSVKPSAVAINGTATATTLIYTLESSPLNFVPIDIVLTKVSQTGTVITQPVISVGTNATNYDDIATGSSLNTLLALLTVGSASPTKANTSPKLAGGTAIYAKVTSPAVGPTVLTYNVDLVGYYKV